MMDWITKLTPYLESYAPWVRVFFVIWLAAGLAVFVLAPKKTRIEGAPTKDKTTGPSPTAQNSQAGRDLYLISAGTVVIAQSGAEQKLPPLRQRIRDLLREINPAIIESLDKGDGGIAVMINSIHLQ